MNNWQKIIALSLGMNCGYAAYLMVAVGSANVLSKFSTQYFLMSGFVSMLLAIAAFNARAIKTWSMVLGVLTAVVLFLCCAAFALAAGFPGSNWAEAGAARLILLFAFLIAVVMSFILPQARWIIAAAAVIFFVAEIVLIPLHMSKLIDAQISTTRKSGGCVLASEPPHRRILSARDVAIGIFVGHHSEKFVSVEPGGVFTWSYSQRSLETRHGAPYPAYGFRQLSLASCDG